MFATLYILSAGVVFRFGPGGATTTLLAWSVVVLIIVTMATCAYATFSYARYRSRQFAVREFAWVRQAHRREEDLPQAGEPTEGLCSTTTSWFSLIKTLTHVLLLAAGGRGLGSRRWWTWTWSSWRSRGTLLPRESTA